MNKKLITLAALSTLAGLASAQSSVTLFGIMDTAVRSVKNGNVGGTSTTMVSGGLASSRWGVRGTEDLGDGMSAGFWLESDIAMNSGASNTTTFWSRRSTVSLSSNSLGELRVGRDLVPTHVASANLDPFTNVGIASAIAFRTSQASVFSKIGGFQLAFRANSSVSYFTPNTLGGFIGQVMVSKAPTGVYSNGTEDSNSRGLRLAYRTDKINAEFATRTVTNTTATVSDFKDTVLGAAYDFGPVKLAVQRRDYAFGTDKLQQSMLHLSAPLGQGILKASYIKANQVSPTASINANDASMFGLGYQYNLAKRTAFYTTVSRIANQSKAVFTVPGGSAVTSANFGGQTSLGYEVGLIHNF